MPTKPLYIIDLPRAICKEKMFQLWSAIEEIKSGIVFDDRYEYRQKIIAPPAIWVFTNQKPDRNRLSNDRWKIWCIRDDDLVPISLEARTSLEIEAEIQELEIKLNGLKTDLELKRAEEAQALREEIAKEAAKKLNKAQKLRSALESLDPDEDKELYESLQARLVKAEAEEKAQLEAEIQKIWDRLEQGEKLEDIL